MERHELFGVNTYNNTTKIKPKAKGSKKSNEAKLTTNLWKVFVLYNKIRYRPNEIVFKSETILWIAQLGITLYYIINIKQRYFQGLQEIICGLEKKTQHTWQFRCAAILPINFLRKGRECAAYNLFTVHKHNIVREGLVVEEHDTTFLYNGIAEPWNTPFLVSAADPVSSWAQCNKRSMKELNVCKTNKRKKINESRAVLTSPNFADANALEIESWAEGRKQVDTIVVMMENTTTSGVCVVDSSRQSPSNGNDGVRGDLKPAQL